MKNYLVLNSAPPHINDAFRLIRVDARDRLIYICGDDQWGMDIELTSGNNEYLEFPDDDSAKLWFKLNYGV